MQLLALPQDANHQWGIYIEVTQEWLRAHGVFPASWTTKIPGEVDAELTRVIHEKPFATRPELETWVDRRLMRWLLEGGKLEA